MNISGTPIPKELLRDRYWAPLLHLFLNCDKLNMHMAKYIDLENHTVKAAALKKISAPWSESERFMLDLALHCFNEKNKVNLGDMDYLDPDNTRLAFDALRMRYGKGYV